jgi:hypothetical protein
MPDLSRFRRAPRTTVHDDLVLDGLQEHETPKVSAVLAALRDLADAPAEPTNALRAVLENGREPEQVRAPASPAVSPVRRPLLRLVTAKVAGLGLLAQLGVGVAAASAITVGAATTDALPERAQDAVAGWVEKVTPFDLPDSADVGRRVSEDATDDTPGVVGSDVAGEVRSDAPVGPDAPPVDGPPHDAASDTPPGFDVVEDTPASQRATPPYGYWRERDVETPADNGSENASEHASDHASEQSEAPAPPPTPDPSHRPAEHPSGG